MTSHPATVSTTSPLTVTLNGSSNPVPAVALSSYTPAVGDVVAVVQHDSSRTSVRMLILGTFA